MKQAPKKTDTRTRKRRAVGVKYSEWITGEICHRMATGEALKAICRSPGMPTFQSVLRWVNEIPEFAKSYAIACDMRAQSIADEILEIADTPTTGTRTKTFADGSEEITTLDQVERSKLRVDSRKWLLARLSPKRYGDRLLNEITGADGGPVELQGPPRPSPEEVTTFARELHQGFSEYLDEKSGEAATFGEHQAGALAEVIAGFATGEENPANRTAHEIGGFLAKLELMRKIMLPPEGYAKPTAGD
jgi:hypothetical protein